MIIIIFFSSFSTIYFTAGIANAKYSGVSTDGSETTAIQKLYYYDLKACINFEKNGVTAWDLSFGKISGQKVGSGDWFKNSGDLTKTKINAGAYIENAIQGDYRDGRINCGQKDNALVSNGLSALNLSIKDVACNNEHGGVLSLDEQRFACSDSLGDKSIKFWPNENRGTYFDTVVKEKTFGGQLPGGGWGLTPLEEYYIKRNSFMIACASGGPHFGNTTLAYKITEWNANTKKWELAGYSQVSKVPKGVYTYLSHYTTCGDLAKDLQEGSDVEAYKDEQEALMAQDPNYNPSQQKPDDNHDDDNCYNSGGAMSLGWILCPILDLMGDAAEKVYDEYVDQSLNIQPQLFSQNPNEGTLKAWTAFQTIANTGFIILALIVIFSQLTGVGIDNYGIKKILPKLIITAVLVNLSYFICILCVDLSNILGNGLQEMFKGLSTGTPTLNITGATITKSIATTGLTGVAVLAAVVGMVGAVWANPAIVLSLLVSALGVVISILFLFILLSARQAAIVVLTVISPVAFVCYALPNTKKYFDKWTQFGKGLLLVYPICGLLVGGGDYVSRLLLSTGFGEGSFLSAFTAMIVGVLPIFFIPTVLKGAFSAMGNIGAKISGFGDRMRSGATNKIRNAEGYKAAQKRGADRRTRIKAGYDSNGKVTKWGDRKARFANSGIGKAIGYQSIQAARVAAANKTREENIQAASELGNISLDYQRSENPSMKTEEILEAELIKARDSGDINRIFSIVDQARNSNMKDSKIAEMTSSVLGGQIGKGGAKLSDGQLRNFREEFGKRYSNDFLKKDFEQADWARKGGVGDNGLAELSGWADNNIKLGDLKDEDVAALSADNLHKLIASGKISSDQAQRVWASNGNMDDVNRLMLGAYANTESHLVLSKKDAENAIDNRGGSGLDEKQITAYTERSPEATVIQDVKIRNSQDGSGDQSNVLQVQGQKPPES